MSAMDIRYELNGTTFVWNAKKAAANAAKHDGITFEQAGTVFFDPFFRLVRRATTRRGTPSSASMPAGAFCSWCMSK